VAAVPTLGMENCSPSQTNSNELAALVADAAVACKTIQQMAEVSASEESFIQINTSVAGAAGLAVDTRISPPVKTPGKNFFNYTIIKLASVKLKQLVAHKAPIVKTGVAGSEVKRRTRFLSEGAMLSYILLFAMVTLS
jgi:hypothetical protein